MKLNPIAFGITCALWWGFGLFLITWWVIAFDGQTGETTAIGHVYRGYSVSAAGSAIGLLWGLADGFVGGLIFAWIYNVLAPRLGGRS